MRMDTKLIYEDETYAIRGAVFEVYKTLGDGYLEMRFSDTQRDRFEVFAADRRERDGN